MDKTDDWKLIEDGGYPKNGTPVLAWAEDYGFDVMFWLDGGWDDGDFRSGQTWPTHWMPLKPPEGADG